jgi:hypothetical protein
LERSGHTFVMPQRIEWEHDVSWPAVACSLLFMR